MEDYKLELSDETIKALKLIAKGLQDLSKVIKDSSLQVVYDSLREKVIEETENVIETSKEKSYTLEEVRKVLAKKSQSGFTLEIKKLICKYGADKLSEVNPECYAKLIKEAEELKDATK